MATETVPTTPTDLPTETLQAFGGDELRARVFYEKYALIDENGKHIETTPQQMWRRVAREIASVEKTPELEKEWEENFYWLLSDWKFVPGGRILFGAGQKRASTNLNCYFFPIRDDSIEAIFNWCKEAARTYSFGGGVGTDISVLRPRGSPVNNSAVVSTGAVSFMPLMSMTTGTIGQAGRRGALMISISVEHPDVLEFINVKKDLSKVNYANVSVRVTDAFMEAVKSDSKFRLHFENEKVQVEKFVRARDIWDELTKAAWQSSEPGLLFWDTVKRYSTTEYNDMEVSGVNPCGEQTLENYGCCCLGSINLSAFVKEPFINPSIDWETLERVSEYATRFLDNVLDYNADKHPLPEQAKASLWSRRIGVGFTGLGDMLIKLRLKYDTDSSLEFVDRVFSRIRDSVYSYSTVLAEEKGTFNAYNPAKHFAQSYIQELPVEVQDLIHEHGLRNAALLTVPPVGSGSIIAGSSSGIEPVFALTYKRRSKSLSQGEFEVEQPILAEYRKVAKVEATTDQQIFPGLPSYFVTAHQIKPEFRVKMQGVVQKYIDTAISSTVNLPESISLEEVQKIYMQAWEHGLKGITIFREGSREGILETKPKTESKLNTDETFPDNFERPKVMHGDTIKLKIPQGSLYVTANTNGRGDDVKEVFVTLGKLGGDAKADAEAIGRLVSLYLQSGGDVKKVVETLHGIRGQYTIWDEGVKMESIPDAISKALEILTTGKTSAPKLEVKSDMCPDCKENTLISENGCLKCSNCGFSRC